MSVASLNVTFNRLRQEGKGCDVTFRIADKKFSAHSAVLISRLDYFRNLFKEAPEKKEKGQIMPLELPLEIDPNIFESILEYIYTYKIVFTLANLERIYKAAEFFLFDELKCKVESFMRSNISIDNFILFTDMAAKYSLKSVEDDCVEFLKTCSLTKVGREHLLTSLSYEHFQLLLRTMNERAMYEDMFHYVVDWILHDESQRLPKLPELFQKIPLNKLPVEFLVGVVAENSIVLDNEKCLNMLIELTFPRQPSILYAMGGKNGSPIATVSKFNSFTSKWTPGPEMSSKRTHFGCAIVTRKIYVAGGFDTKNMNDFSVLDIETQTWKFLKPMQFPRQNCAMAVFGASIYVAGGFDSQRLATVECYSLTNDVWQEVQPMNTKRQGLELVQLDGYLYAIGGDDGETYLSTVERYDPSKNEWTTMQGVMKNQYSCFGSAVLNGRIYVIGKNQFEVYNPREDSWKEMPSPSNNAVGKRLAALDGKLYSIGGFDGKNAIGSVEIFDLNSNSWSQAGEMDVPRSFHGVAVTNG